MLLKPVPGNERNSAAFFKTISVNRIRNINSVNLKDINKTKNYYGKVV